jgi:4-diphosphocytidyl-2-C-methyl-D-erythritol kinase
MPVIVEPARAKVNLTLEVLGRRPDGYHELESLVAFADAADTVSLDTDGEPGVTVSGPFAGFIASRNLIEVTLERARAAAPRLMLGAVRLEKRLPVAAGIGGGSADAAAVLRAVRAASPEIANTVDWTGLALAIGADVPVCLANRAAWMSGIGEAVVPLAALPPLAAVLCNPMVKVPDDKTAQVFKALRAPALAPARKSERPPAFASTVDVVAFMRQRPNSLEAAACGVVPEISTVLERLSGLAGLEIARLSGAGPTCFGIFADAAACYEAAQTLKAAQPTWWVEAVRLE